MKPLWLLEATGCARALDGRAVLRGVAGCCNAVTSLLMAKGKETLFLQIMRAGEIKVPRSISRSVIRLERTA